MHCFVRLWFFCVQKGHDLLFHMEEHLISRKNLVLKVNSAFVSLLTQYETWGKRRWNVVIKMPCSHLIFPCEFFFDLCCQMKTLSISTIICCHRTILEVWHKHLETQKSKCGWSITGNPPRKFRTVHEMRSRLTKTTMFHRFFSFTHDLPATSSTGCLSGWISICRAIHLPSKCANHQPFFLYSSSRCWSAGRTNGIRKYLCAGSRSVLLLFPGWAYDGANRENCLHELKSTFRKDYLFLNDGCSPDTVDDIFSVSETFHIMLNSNLLPTNFCLQKIQFNMLLPPAFIMIKLSK